MATKSKIRKILYSLIAVFIITAAYFFMPLTKITSALFPLIAVFGLIFLILGGMLTWIARNEKGKLKIFLMVTGISAMAPALSAILHNLFYVLAMNFKNLIFLFEKLHAIFFITALIIAPLVFISGAISSIVLLNKRQ